MSIDLLLFTTEPKFAGVALEAGVSKFVIDWENQGKYARQRHADTEINADTPDDLRRMSNLPGASLICRINAFGDRTAHEVETAIEAGATHILLPMVESPNEVEDFLKFVGERVKAGILIETARACTVASELASFPLDLVYVGLNDLSISRRSKSIFEPLKDGLAMRLRETLEKTDFGLGGLTTVDRGHPIPCIRLMAELARHRIDFTFLRRSFKKDIVDRNVKKEIGLIKKTWESMKRLR
jgi:hypothetical protein